MENRFKFRAWDKDGKQFLKGDFSLGIETGEFRGKYGEVFENVKLMQYTGLKDKNGKEIYEGDIIEYKSYCNFGHEKDNSIGDVVWGETGDSDGRSHNKHYEWTVGQDSLADIADSYYKDKASCEIKGNIYENPELLGIEAK